MISSIKVSINIRTVKIFNKLLLVGGLNKTLNIINFTKPKNPKLIKTIPTIFQCEGLNNCFDIQKSTSKIYGFNQKNLVKMLDLKNNYKIKQYPAHNFIQSYIFKILDIKKSLMICSLKNIIEISLNYMTVTRTKKLNTNGAILMETSKNEDYLFITGNNKLFYVISYKNLDIINIFQTDTRFISLSYPQESKFIYGNIGNSPIIYYGNPEKFIKGFKTKLYVNL